MTAFQEYRLPDVISLGLEVDYDRAATLQKASSGFTQLIVHHADQTRVYSFRHPPRSRTILTTLEGFLFGTAHLGAFRMKDHGDYELIDELVGVTDGTNIFQLVKIYDPGSGIPAYSRPIFKPVDGTISVEVDGSPWGSWSLDYTTGVLTVTGSPSNGLDVTVSGEYDVPVIAETLGGRTGIISNLHQIRNLRFREYKIESTV